MSEKQTEKNQDTDKDKKSKLVIGENHILS